MHTHRIAAVQRAFEQGVYWPRWFEAVYNGLGAPTFHHYSPGLYWLVAAVHGTDIRLDQALKLVMTGALLLSGFGVYGWLRYAFSPGAALAGVALYLLHPHVLMRAFYYVGAHPRLLGLLLLPVCLWAFTALHMRSRKRYWVAAVVALAALIVTHNVMAMVGVGLLSLYWLLLAAGYRRPGRTAALCAGRAAGSIAVSGLLAAGAGRPLPGADRQCTAGALPFQQSFSHPVASPQFSVSCSGQSRRQPADSAHHHFGLWRSSMAGIGDRAGQQHTVRRAHPKDRPVVGSRRRAVRAGDAYAHAAGI